ncbi:unnamed protein product [Laminaria digitata]
MRWLHIFEIALKQTERGKWFESTLELQLASFELCVACRGVRTLLVTIGFSIPLSLWGGDDHSDDPLKPTKWRQVPPLRAASVAWIMPVDTLVPTLLESDLQSGRGCFRSVGDDAAVVTWADLSDAGRDRLKNAVRLVSWPPSLHRRTIGGPKRPSRVKGYPFSDLMYWLVESITWSKSLVELNFGYYFNQPIAGVVWPPSLLRLTFGDSFSQPIAGIL